MLARILQDNQQDSPRIERFTSVLAISTLKSFMLSWLLLSRFWRNWTSEFILVKPETVFRWRKRKFQAFEQFGRPIRVESKGKKVSCRSAYDAWLWVEKGI
jgi:hypothetical protein